MKKKSRVPIDDLLIYWTVISKRPTLTLEDYALFFDRAKATVTHFSEAYPRMSERFFDRIHYMVFERNRLLKAATGKHRLANFAHAQMKDVAKKFIPRIKKWFAADIVAAIDRKTPLRDAETLLVSSTKLSYRWAAGIVVSNHIAILLIQLSHFRSGEKYRDDIRTLADNLKNRTRNQKLKTFLSRSHRKLKMPTSLGIDAPM